MQVERQTLTHPSDVLPPTSEAKLGIRAFATAIGNEIVKGLSRSVAWQDRFVPGIDPVRALFPGHHVCFGERRVPPGASRTALARLRRVHLLPHANQPALLGAARRDAERHPRTDVSEPAPVLAAHHWARSRRRGRGRPQCDCAGPVDHPGGAGIDPVAVGSAAAPGAAGVGQCGVFLDPRWAHAALQAPGNPQGDVPGRRAHELRNEVVEELFAE